jgi:hypothetical protein
MLTRFRNLPRQIGRRFWRPRTARSSIPDAAEQSRRSWAQPIQSASAVPDAFREFFESETSNGGPFPYAILTPAYEGFLHGETEKLVCVVDSLLSVLERHGASFTAKCYPLEQVSHLEIATVLLDSRITISGLTLDGRAQVSTWRFNSVTDYLFAPIVERIRLATTGLGLRPTGSKAESFEHWREINYKFMNYARRSLLGCERVLHTVLQPEIRAYKFSILGRTFYRPISPTHVSILTDRELIIILEGARRVAQERYGGTWHFIPVNKIADISVTTRDEPYLRLSIFPAETHPIQILFESTAEPELRLLMDRFQEIALNGRGLTRTPP